MSAGPASPASLQRLAHRRHLLGQARAASRASRRGGGGLAEVELGRGGGGGGAAGRVLELGAQPADEALRLLGGALAVEGDEAVQDVVVGEVRRPAVGAGGLGVDLVVELAEDADEAVVVDLAVPALDGLAGPELLQHVVHLGEGQAGMRRLLALAVGVEPLRRSRKLEAVADERGRRVARDLPEVLGAELWPVRTRI